ncbi:Nodulation protein D 2 [compost metagenome]
MQQVLRLLEQQLSEEELFEPRQSKRRFVLCTTDYVECVLIPPLIQRLKGLAPGVTIEIRILRDTLPEAELASGEIDLVLGFDEYMQVPGYLGKETWLTEPLAGLVRATLELEEERITLAQLIDMPHVFHSPLGTSEASLDSYLKSLGHSRTISVNSQSYMSAAAIVSQSDHLLVLPSMVAELLANHWPLKSLPLPEDVPDYHLNCVWHPVHAQQPALIWLKELMKELVSPV